MPSPYSIPPLVVSFFLIISGGAVLFRNPRVRLNRLFSYSTFSVALWALGYGLLYATKDPDRALFYARLGYVGVVFIPTFFCHFAFEFLGLQKRTFLAISYALSFVFLFVSRTNLFLNGTFTYFWGLYPKAGPLYWIFIVFFYTCFGLCVLHLFKVYLALRKSSAAPSKLNRVKWVLLAFTVASLSISDYLPNYRIEIYPFAYVVAAGWLALMAYGTMKDRVLEIELLSRNATGFLFTAVFSIIPFVVATILASLLQSWPGFILSNGPGPLICAVVCSAMFLATFTAYKNLHARRLCHFVGLLGLWNLTVIFLCIPPMALSVWIYRIGYGIGCLVLLTWFLFWRGYFFEEGYPYPSIGKWFTRAVWLVFLLAGFTPFVLQSLSFDPERITTASIIPGIGHWPFAIWFLMMVGVSAIYPLQGWRFSEKNKSQIGFWVAGSFISAGTAAALYFLFVEGRSPWYWYPTFEFLALVFLMGALIFRMPVEAEETIRSWIWKLGGFGFSVTIISMLVGFLLAHAPKSWPIGVAGGMLIGGSYLIFFRALSKPVQSWVDQTFLFRREFGHFDKAKGMVKQDLDLNSLGVALPQIAHQLLNITPYRSCTIGIMFDDEYKKTMFRSTCIRLPEGELISARQWTEPLVMAFLQLVRKNGGICLREELKEIPQVIHELDPVMFEAAAPVTANGQTVGFIVMGPKEKRMASFHDEDINILRELAQNISQRLGPSVELNKFRSSVNTTLHDVISHDIGPLVEQLNFGYPITQEKIVQTLRKIRDVIRQLRARAQREFEKGIVLEPNPVKLIEVLQRICENQRLAADKKGLALKLNVPASVPGLRLDPALVERCVGNLVTNAIKYTERGSVEISTVVEGKHIVVSVKDTGIGIPQESLDQIFEEGYRVPGRAAEMAEGTGIGLSTVKDMMVALGGMITIESAIGQGSLFKLCFPLPMAAPGTEPKA